MQSYHQIGHHSENLILDSNCEGYSGAILSPVNYTESQITQQTETHSCATFETIFDPQLYYPRSMRGELPSWTHFSTDVDTADLSSPSWWEQKSVTLASLVKRLNPTSVVSPAIVPKVFSNEYYQLNRDTADIFAEKLDSKEIDVLQTVIVSLNDLTEENRALSIASIVSGSILNRVYLIFIDDTPPRRALSDSVALTEACKLVRHLSNSGISVLVGYSALDAILWLTSGADSVATGKFFNLRRFTAGRFEISDDGGRQIPYWTSLEFMALFRGPDVLRLIQQELLPSPTGKESLPTKILDAINSGETNWVGLSWRHYLSQFHELVTKCRSPKFNPHSHLANVEKRWAAADQKNILMEEPHNDGSWLRSWRIALIESQK